MFYDRSYKAVDGLWFMKVEDNYGFERALEIDKEVWKVVPKIQARLLKSMLGCSNTVEGLKECFAAKLDLEGFQFMVEGDQYGFTITLKQCPWYDLLIKSNRQHLAEQVGRCICNNEYSTFAGEFNDKIAFTLKEQLCAGAETCVLEFRLIT